MLNEFEVLEEVIFKLNEDKIPYMISGSAAMNYYCEPRMTRDIDIVVEKLSHRKNFTIFLKRIFILIWKW